MKTGIKTASDISFDEYIEYYRKIAKERHAQRKFIEENTRKVLIEKWKLISIYF